MRLRWCWVWLPPLPQPPPPAHLLPEPESTSELDMPESSRRLDPRVVEPVTAQPAAPAVEPATESYEQKWLRLAGYAAQGEV